MVLQSPSRNQTAPTTLTSQRWQKGIWIIELAGCTTRNEAEALVGWEICIGEQDRPALNRDEFYCDQLVGLRVVDSHTSETLGKVVEVIPSVSADLLEVQRPGGERFLIPLLRVFVKEVDLSARFIRVDLPEGLTEITI